MRTYSRIKEDGKTRDGGKRSKGCRGNLWTAKEMD